MCIVHSIVTNRLETDMTDESTIKQCNRLVNRYTVGVQENILENKRPVAEFLDVLGQKS